MKKIMIKNTISLVLAVTLVIFSPLESVVGNTVSGDSLRVYAEEHPESTMTEIDIFTAEDLMSLAENCHHEAWSSDKFVVLKNDISLENSDFSSIPIFSGIFNGNGHTISGYSNDGTGYVTGFFRYVSRTGCVQSLTIEADIDASEDGYVTGALAGINDGYIRKCVVTGSVSGVTATGGIVGINGTGGLVIDCENRAEVSGFYYTGGIAGRNYGVIRRGINSGNINSTSEWAAENDERQVDVISEITGDLSLISYQSGIDTGGIAGFSRGMILSSRNDAVVGYERVGYNIGGICGRHCGTIFSCTNNGTVLGKKDVGGIAGQQEPYIETDPSKSISDQIARINALADKTARDAEGATPAVTEAIYALQRAAGRTMDDASAMSGDLSEYKLEENRDWAGMIEDRAERAEKEALESLENRMDSMLDRLSSYEDLSKEKMEELFGDTDISDLSEEELRELIDGIEGAAGKEEDLKESPDEDLSSEISDKADEAGAEFNDTINSGIHTWNSGIDDLTENRDILTSDLSDVRYATDVLISVSSMYSAQLTQDAAMLNDQINRTYDLMDDLVRGVEEEGMDYLFSDVSETAGSYNFDGRMVSCRNNGIVNGDINAGGIAGTLAVDSENLENNAIARFELKTGEAYAICSNVEDCENFGIVNVRTDSAGGIVGRAEHGCIRGGCGYGAVMSDDGDHIGGISGYSEGTILSSYSTCTLSGKDLVGGIAGYAVSVKQCVSMPVFGDVRGDCGGIAGQILRETGTEAVNGNDYSDNLYVSGDHYGIDNISYEGITDEVTYDELMQMDGIPSEFGNLKVIFVAGGEVVKIFRASYGDDMGFLAQPEIPDMEGSYGVWPDLSGKKVAGNMVVEAEYISHVGVLASDVKYADTGRPIALLQGQFRETDSIRARLTSMEFTTPDNSAYTDVTIYEIGFDGTSASENSAEYRMRVYVPYDQCRIWRKNGETWTEIPFEMAGSYAQITFTGNAGVIAVTKIPDRRLKYAGYAGIVLLIVIFAAVMIRQTVRSLRKSRKTE
ncbi:MAG: hypothetical protein IKN97_02475 [Lachnospiraceae bacterium]|nr:hypothetical protein [Lachnospiraceae bacterium]